jgi:hypothetical protein
MARKRVQQARLPLHGAAIRMLRSVGPAFTCLFGIAAGQDLVGHREMNAAACEFRSEH